MAGLRSFLQLLENEGQPHNAGTAFETSAATSAVTPGAGGRQASTGGGARRRLVSFQITGDVSPTEHVKQLGAQGLWIRDLADPSCLRARTHISTTDDDINALVAAISAL